MNALAPRSRTSIRATEKTDRSDTASPELMTQAGWKDDEALAFLSDLLNSIERRQAMRDHAAALGQRDAARRIVDALEGLAA